VATHVTTLAATEVISFGASFHGSEMPRPATREYPGLQRPALLARIRYGDDTLLEQCASESIQRSLTLRLVLFRRRSW